jgi:ankyrin repeat protein
MEENVDKLLKKYYKTFIIGKKTFDCDKDKACEYIKESLIMLDNLKKTHQNDITKYSNILNETENESCKLLNSRVEYYLETENNSNNNDIDYVKLFKSIEKGDISEIKKYNINQINFRKLYKNQTLLHYALKFGDITFLKYCFKLGANIDIPNGSGNSLLEYACLEKDPNMISFLLKNGANMKKHLYFRDDVVKNLNLNDSIDIAILCKIVIKLKDFFLDYEKNNLISNKISEIKKYLDLDELIGYNNNTINDLINNIEYLLNKIDKDSSDTYLNIIDDEIKYNLKNQLLGCPSNKKDILLVNLVPFINYPFNLNINWILSLELKYIIKKNIKNKNLIDSNEIKINIVDELWDKYIKTEIVEEDYLGTIISQLITKIKV